MANLSINNLNAFKTLPFLTHKRPFINHPGKLYPDLQKTLFIGYIGKYAGNTTAIFAEIFIDADWSLVNGKYRKIIKALRFRV